MTWGMGGGDCPFEARQQGLPGFVHTAVRCLHDNRGM